jgi:excisionase family DNA binding protein
MSKFTLKQAATELECSRLTVYNHVRYGNLPAIKSIVNGRETWLITQNDLEQFKAKRNAKTALRFQSA